jgi:YidC/Oxa1 family membrane protein insertase
MANQRRFIFFLVAYTIFLALWWSNFSPKQQKPPAPTEIAQQIQTQRDLARKTEQEARTSDTRLSLNDRSKKWDEAIRAYQQIERFAGKGDAAIDAKLQIARIHEERAATDAKNTGDYDQAERIYKDLERHYPRRRAAVTVDGRSTEIVVGEYARNKLQTVLAARDRRHQHNILYKVLDLFVALTGRIPGFSYWFALVLITVIIKAILHPFTKRQFKYMADMQRIAPKMKEVQEKLKGRPADEINRKIMALYKEEGVNPAAGCVPMIAQMAALIPLYQMIRVYEYQFRQGYFFWIGSPLSHQHPQYLATSLALPDVPLLLLYLVSMVLTSRLQPPPADPQQAQTQKMMTYFMPIVFGYMTWIYAWPSAFTFYWLVLNLISTWQQWRILRAVGSPSAAPRSGSAGGEGGSTNNGPDGRRPVQPANGSSSNGRSSVKPGAAKRSGSKKSGRR